MVTFAIDPKKSAVVAIDLQNCNVEKSPMAAPLVPPSGSRDSGLREGTKVV